MRNVILVVLSLLVWNTYAQIGVKNFIDQPYIEVTGTAELEIIPDEIYFSIVVSESDDKSKMSLLEKEKAMIDAMNNMSINTKNDFMIKDFASNFNAYVFKKTDIVATKEYQLIVHDTKTLGAFYMAMEKLGISNISIVKVDHSEIEKYKQEVKVNAVKAGKDKAAYLAEAMSQSVGKALYVQENNYMPYRERVPQAANMSMSMKVMDSEMDAMPEIAFEKIKISSSMLLRFELKE
jgi:uncharacterized protein YggE